MRTVILLLIYLSLAFPLFSQEPDTLDLVSCLQQARQNAPTTGQFELNSQIVQLTNENLSSTNLPSLSAFGKAWYQSDAITVTIPIPGMDGLSIDQFQYNLGLQIDQKIYDGGVAAHLKDLENVKLDLTNSQTEVKLYQLNDIVVQLYYSLLMMRKTSAVMEIKIENLKEQQKVLESAFQNGLVTERDLRKIEVEILNTSQRLSEINIGEAKIEDHLKIVIGKPKQSEIILSGQYSYGQIPKKRRPEYNFFDAQQRQLDLTQSLKSSAMLPKFYAYGQAGYSYPGLNFFENQSDFFYIFGARMGWTIFDWNQTKREKEILETQKLGVGIQLAEFDRNIQVAQNAAVIEMEYLEELMKTDQKIIEQRKIITKASSSALQNGTITSSDYLIDLNSEIASRIEYESHIIQFYQAEAKLLLINGIGVE